MDRFETTRKWVRDLKPGERIDQEFLLAQYQRRTTRRGSEYLDLVLQDRTGQVKAKKWDATSGEIEALVGKGYVRIRGVVEEFQQAPQVRAETVETLADTAVDPSLFLPTTRIDVEGTLEELRTVFGKLESRFLRELLESFLGDEEFCRAFCLSPAATRNHHCYLGGLLEHVHSLIGLARRVATHYEDLDEELLLTGAFLHDIGKVEELDSGPGFAYTREGELIGHVAIGVRMTEERIAKIEGFPADLRDRIVHMILSHHGALEWGAPVVPKTLEALALHHIDNLDAKVAIYRRVVESTAQGQFSPWERTLGTRLYRADAPEQESP